MQFIQNGHMNMRGRGDGMNGENGIDIYILLCVKQMASGKFREELTSILLKLFQKIA